MWFQDFPPKDPVSPATCDMEQQLTRYFTVRHSFFEPQAACAYALQCPLSPGTSHFAPSTACRDTTSH